MLKQHKATRPIEAVKARLPALIKPERWGCYVAKTGLLND